MPVVATPENASTTELLTWVFERINAHDVESLRQCWTPETLDTFPDATCVGGDQIADYFGAKFAAIEGFTLNVVTIAESGDEGFVHWRMTGRHVGLLAGVKGTGKPIELDGIDHIVIRDGKVVSNTIVFDQMKFARQIGFLPRDSSAQERVLKAAFNAKTRAVAVIARRS